MWARSVLLVGVILDMLLCGVNMYTAKLGRLAPPAWYVSFLINFFAIHQNMGLAQCGNTCWKDAHLNVE